MEIEQYDTSVELEGQEDSKVEKVIFDRYKGPIKSVEAIQATEENVSEILDWVDERNPPKKKKGVIVGAVVEIGDYVCFDSLGRIEMLSSKEFEKTYKKIKPRV